MADLNSNLVTALTAENPPRALLVWLSDDGVLKHQPVLCGDSVLNIERDLFDHLSSKPYSDEFLLSLRAYVDGRLAAQKEAHATGGICIPCEDGGYRIAHVNAYEPLTVQGA